MLKLPKKFYVLNLMHFKNKIVKMLLENPEVTIMNKKQYSLI